MRVLRGDVVRARHNGHTAEVIEVVCGGARLRYESGGPYGERGRRLGVWEHLIDLDVVCRFDHDPGDEDRS